MSHEILISELRRKSDRRIAEIRERAKQKAEELRLQKEQQFAEARKVLEGEMARERQNAAAAIIRAAEQEAMMKVDDARRGLADRLFQLALQQLEQVREGDYDGIFARLVSELPSADWEKIRVAPLDVERARTAFPDAEISEDAAITGGLEAESDQGRFKVVSTLRKRLEKGWPYVLPTLLRNIEEEYDARHAG